MTAAQGTWRIALDQTLLEERLTGIGYYSQNLIQSLSRQDTENLYFLFGRMAGWDVVKQANFSFCLFESLTMINLFHFPGFYSNYLKYLAGDNGLYRSKSFPGCKIVVTVHDCIFELRPRDYNPSSLRRFKEMMQYTLTIADRIIVPSQATGQDLKKFFSYPAEKTTVIPLAPADRFTAPLDRNRLPLVQKQYGLPDRYFLFVGSTFERKNLSGVFKALAYLKRRSLSLSLLLVGAHYSQSRLAELFHKAPDLSESEVILAGYVPETDLPYLYAGALALVYPSFYEGFGLPPLEAMSVGTPVITSITSALPEVVGEAALLVDPTQPDEIAEAMEAVVKDNQLRRDLSKKGRKWVANFSWEKTGQRTLEVYRDLLKR
ncbi:MAG: glycosyltransferase family 4 protein [Firmicutes bacterium]|nr:glycosyltransferase family 4 protein [Bacillota bacterium]MCL5039857.1 glycosyltransferase family 4 protein [Bacillota bacterium]